LRNNLGIQDNHLVILFAGKFEEKKDPQILMDAFLSLNRRDLHLLFVGNGALEAKLKAQAKDNRNIHFMDFQNQSKMPAVYQCCDLFCLPSMGPNETWGLAVNEAMASGKAILASDAVGCATDLVKIEYNGAIFKAREIDSILARLQHLTEDKARLVNYGEQSRIMIKDWNFTNIVETIENKLLNETH